MPLYQRLSVIPIPVPSLQERHDDEHNDIQELTEYFVSKICREKKSIRKEISPEAMRLLLAYPWPGNVRELGNVIERALTMADARIDVSDLSNDILRWKQSQESMNVKTPHGLETDVEPDSWKGTLELFQKDMATIFDIQSPPFRLPHINTFKDFLLTTQDKNKVHTILLRGFELSGGVISKMTQLFGKGRNAVERCYGESGLLLVENTKGKWDMTDEVNPK